MWVIWAKCASETEHKQTTIKVKMSKLKLISLLLILAPAALDSATDCSKLRVGQFLCPDPDSSYKYIDEKTQSVAGCSADGKAMGEKINSRQSDFS